MFNMFIKKKLMTVLIMACFKYLPSFNLLFFTSELCIFGHIPTNSRPVKKNLNFSLFLTWPCGWLFASLKQSAKPEHNQLSHCLSLTLSLSLCPCEKILLIQQSIVRDEIQNLKLPKGVGLHSTFSQIIYRLCCSSCSVLNYSVATKDSFWHLCRFSSFQSVCFLDSNLGGQVQYLPFHLVNLLRAWI